MSNCFLRTGLTEIEIALVSAHTFVHYSYTISPAQYPTARYVTLHFSTTHSPSLVDSEVKSFRRTLSSINIYVFIRVCMQLCNFNTKYMYMSTRAIDDAIIQLFDFDSGDLNDFLVDFIQLLLFPYLLLLNNT